MGVSHKQHWFHAQDVGFIIGNYPDFNLDEGLSFYIPSNGSLVYPSTKSRLFYQHDLNTPFVKIPYKCLAHIRLIVTRIHADDLKTWSDTGKTLERHWGRGPVSLRFHQDPRSYTSSFPLQRLLDVGFAPRTPRTV